MKSNTSTNKQIDDNIIDVGKSSNRFYTSLPQVNTTNVNLPKDGLSNDMKQWFENDLNKIKNEEPVFTNEKIYMQLIPEAKLELDHKTPSKTEFISLTSNLESNDSNTDKTGPTNQMFAEFNDSLNTANSRNFPFRYENPPKNRKYEPSLNLVNNNKDQSMNYLDNEAVVNDYQKQKKKIYFPTTTSNQNNYPPKHQLDDVRRLSPPQPTLVHNPNQHHYNNNLAKKQKDELNNKNNYSTSNYTNRGDNNRDYSRENSITNYKQPTKLEYDKVRTSLDGQLPATLQNQNNESNRPREFYVKPVNTFYETDPDPPAVQYNPPPVYKKPSNVISNPVRNEQPIYPKERPILKKNKIPVYNLNQSQNAYTVKPKPYYSSKPTPSYPPYEYHFNMPVSNKPTTTNAAIDPKNDFAYNSIRRPQNEINEYAPPLPSPKPYDTNPLQNNNLILSNPIQNIANQGRSISSATTNPEPNYLTGFTPVITEHKYSRPAPIDDYRPIHKQQPIYKSQTSNQNNKLVHPNGIYKENDNKYNFQLLNSGLISINELDNQIDRDKIANYPNQPYTRASSTNKLEQPVATENDRLERLNPQFENLILPENKPYTYPSKPNHLASVASNYASPSNEDEILYEKYKSMIRSRLPSKNLAYRPYERLNTSPNFVYNVSGTNHPNNNYENELTPYNYPKSYYNNNQLSGHSNPNHETAYNNSQPNDYLTYTPNAAPKETVPLFFSKYNQPDAQQPPILNNKPPIELEDNDPDL